MGFIFPGGRRGAIHVSWRCRCGLLQLSVCWGVLCQDVEEAAQGPHGHGCVVGGAAIWGERQKPLCECWVVATVPSMLFRYPSSQPGASRSTLPGRAPIR